MTIETSGELKSIPSSDIQYWRRALLSWYALNGRHLPWRSVKDPYRIWLSEIILQQTRIVQGQPYYERFIETFPTVESLASAPIDDVMHLWQGLGYYSRARNLHEGARQIVARGSFPHTYEEWCNIKGVGAYTAAAIASFAFDEPKAVVDGNVYRVLSRYYGIETPIDISEGKKLFARLAQQHLDVKRPADYNQAIMDFGALQCVPKSPVCASCPFSDRCVAQSMQSVDRFPVKSRSTQVQTVYMVLLYVRTASGIWLHKRTEKDIWQGLYEPLTLVFPHRPTLAEVVRVAGLPKEAVYRQVADSMKHLLSHRELWADGYEVVVSSAQLPQNYICVPEAERDHYAVSRLVARFYQQIDSVKI